MQKNTWYNALLSKFIVTLNCTCDLYSNLQHGSRNGNDLRNKEISVEHTIENLSIKSILFSNI